MQKLIIPSISIIMSVLYYTPWIFGASRANLGPYLLAFLWFLGVWVVSIVYAIKAYKLRKLNRSLKNRYLLGFIMIAFSYLLVWIGIFNGLVITV